MARDATDKALSESAWKHIAAEEYGEAETAIRQRIAIADSEDFLLRWELFGLLASTLNSLARHDEATAMLRESLAYARKVGPSYSGIQISRYMLANQALVRGDPAQALTEALPIPEGQGHVECLLHSVAAHALWKLNRGDESRQAAQRAIAASPTDERRSELTIDLAHVLGTEDM
jgi:tetratricopeptide (TPR) repeat protein